MNYLLTNGSNVPVKDKKKENFSNCQKIGKDTAVLFWTKEPVEIDPLCLNDGKADEHFVKSLFEAAAKAESKQTDIVDENMFYCCTLSSAAARVSVRDWIAISLAEYKRNLARWFDDISIRSSGKMHYPSLSSLVDIRGKSSKKQDQNSKKQDPSSKKHGRSSNTYAEARTGAALWSAALKGSPVPLTVLTAVLGRIFTAGQKMTAGHAALIKLILNRHDKNSRYMEPQLDLNNDSAAYLCGRLFAVIENIQQAAMGYDLNRTVKDRFFSAAATLPAITFGRMLKLSQNHLTKLRRDNTGAHCKLEAELTSIMAKLPEFPERLSPTEQGQFALGYYHQKEHRNNEIRKNKEK